jgi:hypothetical protein
VNDNEGAAADRAKEVDVHAYYRDSVTRLAQALIDAISVSQATRDLPGDSLNRRFWASVLHARLCGLGASLQRLLPGSPSNRAGSVWDSAAVISVARTAFETYLGRFYLCTEQMSDEDYRLRLRLIQLHDATERPRILKKLGIDGGFEDNETYDKEVDQLRSDISSNSIFQALPLKKQSKLLSGDTPYYLSQDELLERLGANVQQVRGLWELFSSHAHSYPFSFYRAFLHPGRGTGRENDVDKNYCAMAAELTGSMLEHAAQDIKHLFPDVSEYPRHKVDWDTMVCRPIRNTSGFVMGMARPGGIIK